MPTTDELYQGSRNALRNSQQISTYVIGQNGHMPLLWNLGRQVLDWMHLFINSMIIINMVTSLIKLGG